MGSGPCWLACGPALSDDLLTSPKVHITIQHCMIMVLFYWEALSRRPLEEDVLVDVLARELVDTNSGVRIDHGVRGKRPLHDN